MRYKCRQRKYFYPRPPRGGRPAIDQGFGFGLADFYPRPPRGGRHPLMLNTDGNVEFLSTPSARRATIVDEFLRSLMSISIHALREEGDPPTAETASPRANFYPRPPRGGRP